MRALNHSDVARVFNLAFVDYKVVMNGGHAEPLYIPSAVSYTHLPLPTSDLV